jgi:oligogalacturonide lyase
MYCPVLCRLPLALLTLCCGVAAAHSASAQIGRRWPSEKKVISDPVTRVPLTFLTSTAAGDSKIYPTHPQWTADGEWIVFRSRRVPGQAFAVHEKNGDIVQLTEKGYMGALCVAQKSLKLFYLRDLSPREETRRDEKEEVPAAAAAETASSAVPASSTPPVARRPRRESKGPFQIIELDLTRLLADSAAGKVEASETYERVCGTLPEGLRAHGDLALDANEEVAYFRATGGDVGQHLAPGTKIAETFGPRGMGAGPSGLRAMNLATGAISVVVDVPFQIGHVQSNPYEPGEIVFCWETGGKSPQRTWTVRADGTGLRPLYPEAAYEWVTHEAVISKDEVALAIMGHRKPGTDDEWGPAGTREHPTGLGIVNLRTREMVIAGQTPSGSGLWHVHGSSDGRWAVGDDFSRSLYLIDRNNSEMMLWTTGHKATAADHPHPTFSPDGTRINIQSAMLSEDGRSLNICVVPVPENWLKRTYPPRITTIGNP